MANVDLEQSNTNPTRSFYDRISRVYDQLADSSEQQARQVGLELLAAAPGESILEIGFGTGHSLAAIAQAVGPTGQACGVDISEGMREVTAELLTQEGLSDRVELKVAGVPPIPYQDALFDAVLMSLTLELFPLAVIPEVLRETRRVLKPEGRLGLVAMNITPAGEHESTLTHVYKWMHRHFPHIVDCQPIDARRCVVEAGLTITNSKDLEIWTLPVVALVAHAGAEAQAAQSSEELQQLVAQLASSNGNVRQAARQAIVAKGSAATPVLIEALSSQQKQVRWEAATALVALADPAAVSRLLDLCESEQEFGISWLAAKGLVEIGRHSVEPLAQRLTEQPASYQLYRSAHHVFRELAHGNLREPLQPVLSALGGYEPEVQVPVAAENLLLDLRKSK